MEQVGLSCIELQFMEEEPREDSRANVWDSVVCTSPSNPGAGKTWALRHKDRKHSVLLVPEMFISRVNNNNKLVYGCEFHCLPQWGSHLLLPFRASRWGMQRPAWQLAQVGGAASWQPGGLHRVPYTRQNSRGTGPGPCSRTLEEYC